MDNDFTGMTPEQVEARCYSLLGLRKKTPEEMEQLYREKEEKRQREQTWLEKAYYDGDDAVFQRRCPVCNKVFYTTNHRRIYDDYYRCSRYVHRTSAKFDRILNRMTSCQQCGKKFTPARSGARFCCAACKQKAYRERKQMGQKEHTQ